YIIHSTHSSPCTFGWCFCCEGRSSGPGRRHELLRGRVASSPRVKAAQCPRSLARHVGAYREGVNLRLHSACRLLQESLTKKIARLAIPFSSLDLSWAATRSSEPT